MEEEELMTVPHHERIEDPAFRRAVELLDAGDVDGLSEHLERHPGVVVQRVSFADGNYFQNPGLLEFIAENPIRNGRLPANVVDVARVILEAGAKRDLAAMDEALGLVGSGCVPRQCGVQVPLIELLCGYGATAQSALPLAVAHGEFEAAGALLRVGAAMDLPAAAAFGRVEECGELLPGASALERHRALALAAQFGYAEVVRMLVDAGEEVDRFNPPGNHGHSTPLHQAALAGHMDVVRLLVERGARLDIEDRVWRGTPLGWAVHGGKTEVAEYLARKSHRN